MAAQSHITCPGVRAPAPAPGDPLAEDLIKEGSVQDPPFQSRTLPIAAGVLGPKPARRPVLKDSSDDQSLFHDPDQETDPEPGPQTQTSVTGFGFERPDTLEIYKSRKTRVSFSIGSGEVSLTAVSFTVTPTSVAVVTRTDTDAMGYVPGIGESLNIRNGADSYRCTFPGSVIDIPELGISVMVFIREDIIP